MIKKSLVTFLSVILGLGVSNTEINCMKKPQKNVFFDTSKKFRASDGYDFTIAPYKGSYKKFTIEDKETGRENQMNGVNGYQMTAVIVAKGYVFCVENKNTVLIWD